MSVVAWAFLSGFMAALALGGAMAADAWFGFVCGIASGAALAAAMGARS